MSRRKTTSIDLPPNTTFDKNRNLFRWRNPKSRKRFWIGSDKNKAIEIALKANLEIEHQYLLNITFAEVIEKMQNEWVYMQPWSDSYRNIICFRLNALKKDWGEVPFNEITRKKIGAWLKDRAKNGHTYKKWRSLLINVWEFAMTEEITDYNEASATLKMSTSKKLAANRKKRKRLTPEAFWAIHDHEDTPLFLKVAMQQSLITLQSRQQIVNTRYEDYKDDGFLYYIRNKTAGDTDMAFIRIKITKEIDQIRRRALDNVISPYLVHKSPLRRDPKKISKKPHWTYIYPEELGRAFSKARDKTGIFENWLPEEKPGFHEIRSLGGRLYRADSYQDKYIQELMSHTDMKTTEIYLSDPKKLKPDHFRIVHADMTLARTRQIKL